MINRIRLRLKLENLLTYLRNKRCTWQVISLLSLKGLDKQETDSCGQRFCAKTDQTVVLPHQKPWTPCPTARHRSRTDTRDHNLIALVRGCYAQQDAGKTKKSASGTADSASRPITPTMNSAYNKSFSQETKFTRSACSSLRIHLSLNCHTYPFTVCCENNWKEF